MFSKEEVINDPELLFDFIECFFGFKLYKYQKKFLMDCFSHNRIAGRWPRQSGKSQTVSIYVVVRILMDGCKILITSPTQTQSDELYLKVRSLVEGNDVTKAMLKKVTESEMIFDNGGRIKSLPSGNDGRSIRGHTADVVIIEEAGIMKDKIVNTVIIPMIASKKESGQIIKIGTPLTKNHFHRSCYVDPNYHVTAIKWQEVVNAGQYSQEFIDEQRTNLLDIEFATEYEAEFVNDAYAFFTVELIESCVEDYALLTID